MNINLLAAPLAAGAATHVDERGAAQARHRAWQSAMEQAQLASWFAPSQDLPNPGDGERATAANASPAGAALARVPVRVAQETTPLSANAAAREFARIAPQAPQEAGPAARVAQADTAANPPSHDGLATHDANDRVDRVGQDTRPMRSQSAVAASPARSRPAVVSHGPAPLAEQGVIDAQGPRAKPATMAQLPSLPAFDTPVNEVAPVILLALAQSVQQAMSSSDIEATESAGGPAWVSTRTGAPQQDSPPTRLHVEWTRDGARLWLGVDQDQLQRVPQLAGQLQQWLADSGVKLVALVCNGRVVYQRARAAQPQPFPHLPPGDFE